MDRTLRAKSAISQANTYDNTSIISVESPAAFYNLSILNKNVIYLSGLLRPLDNLLLSLANYPDGLFFDTIIQTLTNDTYFNLINNLQNLRSQDTTPEFEMIVIASIHSLQALRRFINIHDESKLSELRIAIENSKLNNYNQSVSGVRTFDNLIDNSFNVIRIEYSSTYESYLNTFGYGGDDRILPYLTNIGLTTPLIDGMGIYK
jgi:hypothetical protein